MKKEKKVSVSNEDLISNNSFERLRSRNHNKLIRGRIFYGVVALGLCALFAVICAAVFFRVEDIDVRGNTEYSDADIVENSGVKADENMFLLNTSQIRQNLVLNFPYIMNVKIGRQIPSTVVLDITEEKPEYYIEIGGEYFVVSQTLKVLEMVTDYQELDKGYGVLMKLTPPDIRYCVLGRTVLFKDDGSYEYMNNVMGDIRESALYENITVVNCANRFGIYVVYSGEHGEFLIKLGNTNDIEEKLLFASEMLKSFSENDKGTMDVQSNPGFVILDEKVELG